MKEIQGLGELAPHKKAVLCDLWGVLHSGQAVFPGAIRVLRKLREAGIFVLLLSNSPKPGGFVKRQIQTFGIEPDLYGAILTSGDLAREYLDKNQEKSFFFLGPERDQPTIEGLRNPKTEDLREADYILCTGFFEDWGFDPKAYEAFLSAGAAAENPLLCANPDLEVDIGPKRVLCAGSLAKLYEKLGGRVHWLGKPEAIAYQKSFQMLPKNVEPEEILVIGDNLETDILGARRQGIESLFITSGLHGRHAATKEELEEFVKSLNIQPDFYMGKLDW